MISALFTAATGNAAGGPVSCKLGAYVVSAHNIDMAKNTFDADFWLWSICPDKETEPLKSIEFVNGAKVDTSLYSITEKDKQWWTTMKVKGSFRQDFSLTNYPFDDQTLRVVMEEGGLDTRDLVYTADTVESKIDPDFDLSSWHVEDFEFKAGDVTHPTTYGDPSLSGGHSTYAQLELNIGLERDSHWTEFLRASFAVFIAACLALVSLLITDGRVGLLGATMFTVVLSFVSLDRLLGPHESMYLLDKLHFVALAVIMAAAAWGVRSLRAISLGADRHQRHRSDLRAAAVLFALYLLANGVLVGMAIAHHHH